MTEPGPALTMTLGKSRPRFRNSVSPWYVGEVGQWRSDCGGRGAGRGASPLTASDFRLCWPPSQHHPRCSARLISPAVSDDPLGFQVNGTEPQREHMIPFLTPRPSSTGGAAQPLTPNPVTEGTEGLAGGLVGDAVLRVLLVSGNLF